MSAATSLGANLRLAMALRGPDLKLSALSEINCGTVYQAQRCLQPNDDAAEISLGSTTLFPSSVARMGVSGYEVHTDFIAGSEGGRVPLRNLVIDAC